MSFHLIHLENIPIFEQLLLEERLLREDTRNFIILNTGSPPAIVMGISGKVEELVHKENTLKKNCPIIKRFSGGGTVFIDESTLFLSFICSKNTFDFPAYPEKILKWSESFYQKALALPEFALRENDFVIGAKKCGGNAQYITKDRFLQHTSFLWDFTPENMECLLHPRKTPNYREGRPHKEFLCTLKDHFPSKEAFFEKIHTYAKNNHEITLIPYQKENTSPKTRCSTTYIKIE